MVKRTGPRNYQTQSIIAEIEPKAHESRFWKRIVQDLKKPSRQKRVINVYKIDKYAKEGETIIVPGKVLSVVNERYFRPKDVTYLRGDYSKINKELGWSPRISLESMVEKMVKFDHDIASGQIDYFGI